MNPCNTDRNQDYVLGALSSVEADRLEQHLIACSRCAHEVEDFRALFASLQDLPLPIVPPGIVDAVISRLAPESARGRLIDRLRAAVHQPLFAAASGIVAGLLLTLFREPLALTFGRLTGGIVASTCASLATGLSGLLRNLQEVTVVLEVFARLFMKLEPIVRALGGALMAVTAQASALSVLLSLATALFLGRLMGQLRREELSHAKH
jgi:Putative zinc-finger